MAIGDSDKEQAHYPCPACGQTLYGWTAAHDPLDRGKKIVLDRCENCGLAVTRAEKPPEVEPEIHRLITANDGATVELVAPNRRSFQGGLGGAQWAGLEPELHRLHLTPESLKLLLAKQGLELRECRTPFTNRSYGLAWQTLVNAFTYRDNFLRNARAKRIPDRAGAKGAFLYYMDYVVTILVAIPAAMFSLPMELLATVMKRGGVMDAEAVRTAEPT